MTRHRVTGAALAVLLIPLLFAAPSNAQEPPTSPTFTMSAERVGMDTWQVYIGVDHPGLTFVCTLVREDTRQPIECPTNRPFTIRANPATPWRFEAGATDPEGVEHRGELNYQG